MPLIVFLIIVLLFTLISIWVMGIYKFGRLIFFIVSFHWFFKLIIFFKNNSLYKVITDFLSEAVENDEQMVNIIINSDAEDEEDDDKLQT